MNINKGKRDYLIAFSVLLTVNVIMLYFAFQPNSDTPAMSQKLAGKAIKPAHLENTENYSEIRDTFFVMKEVSYLFQGLPKKITSQNSSASRASLTQKIKTSAINEVSMSRGGFKPIMHFFAWPITIFLFIGTLGILFDKNTTGQVSGAFLCSLIFLIGVLTIINTNTGSTNDIYFDNATDKACTVSIDNKKIAVPNKKYVKVNINSGPHLLKISFEGQKTGTEKVINIEGSNSFIDKIDGSDGLVFYNIAGSNTYYYNEANYSNYGK